MANSFLCILLLHCVRRSCDDVGLETFFSRYLPPSSPHVTLTETPFISLQDNLLPGEDVCLTPAVSITVCRLPPDTPPFSPLSANKALAYYSCGILCVSENINHHVLSSRRSHPTVLRVSHDWHSRVNNAALSVLAQLRPYSPTWCAC